MWYNDYIYISKDVKWMDAHNLLMLRDFIGVNKVLFQIPVYQRNYVWSTTNCNRLLDDIKTIIDTGNKHFLGTFVVMAANVDSFKLQKFIIIDGQQRLTTMMIILKVLTELAKVKEDTSESEIWDSYLHNKYCTEEFKVKLKPVKTDNEQFLAFLNDKFDEINKKSDIYLNYELCKKRIASWIENDCSIQDVLDALTKLEIVDIVLEKDKDDPQIIFESINSTGKDLSNADLIRNFLLMDAENQDELYEKYWLKTEKLLMPDNDATEFNLFFMQYVIFKTSVPVNERHLYERFVQLYKDNHYTQEVMLKELNYYANIYAAFVNTESKYPDRVKVALKKLRLLKQTTCYPFLLHVFDDYEQKVITGDVLEKVVTFMLAYLLRRMVCGVPSNSLRGLFTYLYNRVFKVTENKKKYYETINKFLWTVTSKDVVPSDISFSQKLVSEPIYGNDRLCKFLLMDIENGDSKEKIDAESLTVEHIMPQTLSADWKGISPEDHQNYLHILGNLSVTGYNSELSNKSFSEKKDIIKQCSKATVLNKDVLDKDVWGIQEIKNRGSRLADIVSKRYKIEKVLDEDIVFEYLTAITLGDYANVTGRKLVSFKFEDETYQQNKFSMMLEDMVKILDRKKPGLLEKLATDHYSFTFAKKKKKSIHISNETKDIKSPVEVKKGVYIEVGLSAWSVMRFIERLLEVYGVDKSLFMISVIDVKDDDIDIDDSSF